MKACAKIPGAKTGRVRACVIALVSEGLPALVSPALIPDALPPMSNEVSGSFLFPLRRQVDYENMCTYTSVI